MTNKIQPGFGYAKDEQPNYWRTELAQQAAKELDRHFVERAHGKRIEKSISSYAIPRSQKAILKENKVGGIPQVVGGVSNWDKRYLESQSRIAAAPGLSREFSEEVDVTAALSSRLASNAAAPGGPTHGPMPGHGMATGTGRGFNQPSTRVCTLKEGYSYFQPLQIQGFGTTQPLAKSAGQLQGIQGREFEINGTVTAYVVDGLQTIDLSKMDASRLKPLVRVSAPFLGTILVPQDALNEVGGQGPQRAILNDGRGWTPQQMQQMQQQQMLQQAQQNQQRQILTSAPPPSRPASLPQRPVSAQEQLAQQSREILKRRGLLRG